MALNSGIEIWTIYILHKYQWLFLALSKMAMRLFLVNFNGVFLIRTYTLKYIEPSWNPLNMKLDDAHNREMSSNLRHLMIIPHILYIYPSKFRDVLVASRRVGWSSVPLCVLTFCSRWRRIATNWLGIYLNEPPTTKSFSPWKQANSPNKKNLAIISFSGTTTFVLVPLGRHFCDFIRRRGKNGRFRVRSGEDGISLLPPTKTNIAGWSIRIVSIGNTSSIWVYFPASHVSLPECTSVWSPIKSFSKSRCLEKCHFFLTLAWGLRLNIFVEMT